MPRYFIEVGYNGSGYAGFQKQLNANTIQSEVEKALSIYFNQSFALTGSSRTDAGVHAYQNYFHVDSPIEIDPVGIKKTIYHLNAILPADVVLKGIELKSNDAHCRFDALYRKYAYRIYQEKNPFLSDYAYYFPYPLDITELGNAAEEIMNYKDFEAFSKRSTQVQTFKCRLFESRWALEEGVITYHVAANRFLRGMIRGLVGTMLQVGRGKMTLSDFKEVVLAKDPSKVNFAVPAHGLTLMEVNYQS